MRLIDADELPVKTDWHKQYVLYTAIDEAPTIDAAPVVRCGQCKHWKTADDHCTNPAGLCATGKKARNNYCIFGERKDGDG